MHYQEFFNVRPSDFLEKLPRLLHFVWAGGRIIMPLEQREAVIGWAKANPSFRVYVWVDLRTTDVRVLSKYFYADDPNSFFNHRNIFLKDITTFVESQNGCDFVMPCPNEHIQDVWGTTSAVAHYEINRFDPNYGSSSDALRYLILFQYGGVYFDGDINRGVKNLEALYESLQTRTGNVFLIGEKSQDTNCPGNDAFVCTVRHPWMREIVDTVVNNYIAVKMKCPVYAIDKYSFDTEDGFIQSTLHKTGPQVIVHFLCMQDIPEAPVFEACSSKVMPMTPIFEHRLSREFYQPFEANTLGWVVAKRILRKVESEDDAIAIAINTIRFEANTLGFMRFDDHVRHIMMALDNPIDIKIAPSDAEKKIADMLLAAIRADRTINTENIVYVQYFTRHANFFEYYQTLPNLVKYTEQDAKDFAELVKEYQKPPNDDKKFIELALLSAIKNAYFHHAVKFFHTQSSCSILLSSLRALNPTEQLRVIRPSVVVVAPPVPKLSTPKRKDDKKCVII